MLLDDSDVVQGSTEEKKEMDRFITEHSTQYIVRLALPDGSEHWVCTYPRFWKEKRYLKYTSQVDGRTLVAHCIPQCSQVSLDKEIVRAMNKDEIKKIRRSPQSDEVDEDEKVLKPTIVETSSEINNIMSAMDELGKLRSEKRPDEERKIKDQFDSSPHGTPLDLHQRFLDDLKPHVRELRRTYSERVEMLSSIRGRLTNRGMLRLVTHPSNRFECKFDDFFVQAPIYRVISSCLKIVSSTDSSRLLSWDINRLAKQRAETRRLLEHFNEVEPYGLPQAVQALRQFMRRPPREFRKFHPLADTMLSILIEKHNSVSTQGDINVKYYHLEYTNLLWEDFLERVFKHYDIPHEVQKSYPPAWINHKENDKRRKKYVDFSLNDGEILIDAKYMEKNSTLKAAYQHQMFYYMISQIKSKFNQTSSGSLTEDIGSKSIILVYPVDEDGITEPSEPIPLNQAFSPLFEAIQAHKTTLLPLGIPFPQPSHFKGSPQSEKVVETLMGKNPTLFATLLQSTIEEIP